MDKRVELAGWAALGAGLMYLMDPDWGRRRRGLLRDKMVRAGSTVRCAAGPVARDLANRSRGFAAAVTPHFKEESPDNVLEARIRSAIGRTASHPHSIQVSARAGHITVAGPILASEENALLKKIKGVRGVQEVENQLEAHEKANDVPGLQGGSGRRESHCEYLQVNWSPGPRFLAVLSGSAIAYYGLARRDLAGGILAAAGIGFAARGATNMELKRLVGIDAGHRAVDIQKTIHVAAPVEKVFSFWSEYENFPHFMSHVLKVEDLGNGRSRWKATGPLGIPTEWTAIITERVPNEVLAWKTEQGSGLQNAGIVRFDPEPGGTRVFLRLSYNPPAGAAGHTLAVLLGANPKRQLDEDLVRMKTFIEMGVPPHDAVAAPAPEFQVTS